MCCAYLNIAQKTVSGKVTDAVTGETMPGVKFWFWSKNKGTITNNDGFLYHNPGRGRKYTGIFFIGYRPDTITVTTSRRLMFQLKVEALFIEDIVVVGYGVQRKSDLTGSVVSVKSEDLTRIPTSSPMQALEGKVPGLQVASASGAPGSGVVVRVRGVGTFNNSNPIYVVDGVILDNIDYLNTADIESMEILKDASATAIYGSRGANGVIIVTTKKSKLGVDKIPLTYPMRIATRS